MNVLHKKWFHLLVLACIFGGFVYAFSRPKTEKPLPSAQQTTSRNKVSTDKVTQPGTGTLNQPINTPDPESRINEYALMEMTSKSFPKMYSRLGKKAFERANSLIKPAALKALENPNCDRVDTVSFSEKSTQKSIRYFVDCQNGQRVLLSEADLKDTGTVLTEFEKAKSISDSQAIQMCLTKVKQRLNFPSTFESSWYNKGIYRSQSNSTVTVTIDFTAKNGFGLELPASAKCEVSQSGLSDKDVAIYDK